MSECHAWADRALAIRAVHFLLFFGRCHFVLPGFSPAGVAEWCLPQASDALAPLFRRLAAQEAQLRLVQANLAAINAQLQSTPSPQRRAAPQSAPNTQSRDTAVRRLSSAAFSVLCFPRVAVGVTRGAGLLLSMAPEPCSMRQFPTCTPHQ